MIDRHVLNIEKSLNKNNIQTAFKLIFELKTNYPQNKRVEDLFKKNKLKYIKKMKISSAKLKTYILIKIKMILKLN